MSIGFTIIKHSPDQSLPALKCQSEITYSTASANYSFYHNTNEKFQNDKLFSENKKYIFGIDGPILNLSEFKNEYQINSWDNLFLELFEKYKSDLPKYLKGDFSGFVFEKETEQLLFFNNDVGTRRIYYAQSEDNLIIVPALIQLSDFFTLNKKENKLNRFAAYSLLTYGTMSGNQTLIENATRLGAGEALILKNKKLNINRYIDYNNIVYKERPEAAVLEGINDRFLHALRLEMEKDVDYGYESIGTLSGGLDSRMSIMLADKLGYKIKSFCFSQSGYYDEHTARAIAKSIGQEFVFLPLDKAGHLFDYEENLESYDALTFWTNSAHFAWGLKQLDLEKTGIIHTGIIGGGVFGSLLTAPRELAPNLTSRLISKKLYPKIETQIKTFAKNYVNEEIYALYNRMLNMTISGTYICAPYGYHATPFMDSELMKLIYSIPPEKKYYHHIFIKWINKYHPEVTRFPWERTRMNPTAHWKTKFSRYTLKLEHLYRRYTGNAHMLTMTPYDLWEKQYPGITEFFQQEYDQRIDLLEEDKELHADVRLLFESGNLVEKSMAMTLLGGVERYGLTM
ncbi:MAG: asparagine synthase-related protein [Saprospiraceae bacterium]